MRDGEALIAAEGARRHRAVRERRRLRPREPRGARAAADDRHRLGTLRALPRQRRRARRRSRGLADAIAPGGFLVYTGQPWHPQLELIARALTSHRGGAAWVMRRRTQGEMDQLVEAAGFRKVAQRIDEWGIFTVSLAERVATMTSEPPHACSRADAALADARPRGSLFLGPFFFATTVSRRGSRRSARTSASVVFDWEHAIPFVPWTIVPYWSIDLLYARVAVRLRRSARARHAREAAADGAGRRHRVVPAVPAAIHVRAAGDRRRVRRPVHAADGLRPAVQPGAVAAHRAARHPLGAVRAQAPRRRARAARRVVRADRRIGADHLAASLHRRADRRAARLFLPLAVAAGAADAARRRALDARPAPPRARRALCGRSAGRGGVAMLVGGRRVVAAVGRGGAGARRAQLRVAGAGRDSRSATDACRRRRTCCSRPTSRARSSMRRHGPARARAFDHVADDVWLGRMPTPAELERGGFAAIVDLTCELPLDPCGRAYVNLPVLDLTLPDRATLGAAVEAIERLRGDGRVLVCCALGVTRSATAVAGWLVATGRAPRCGSGARARARGASPDRARRRAPRPGRRDGGTRARPSSMKRAHVTRPNTIRCRSADACYC